MNMLVCVLRSEACSLFLSSVLPPLARNPRVSRCRRRRRHPIFHRYAGGDPPLLL
jgi:hypothetical protein